MDDVRQRKDFQCGLADDGFGVVNCLLVWRDGFEVFVDGLLLGSVESLLLDVLFIGRQLKELNIVLHFVVCGDSVGYDLIVLRGSIRS